ncbi:MAG: hypothetical protein A2Z52_00570 [Candidatus Moranbacteria bacterium RBG_19FT_COMBO_42_6]|nr:MAG: hypothetical protein A2Z52_00570 [Candidatus Moranbacteria bacterium RBG_19FT_COMBO_42_6]
MEMRANIISGPGYVDFRSLLPRNGYDPNSSKKVLFFLEDPAGESSEEKVILLTLIKTERAKNETEAWSFEGLAADRPFKGFFSSVVKMGWIEAVVESQDKILRGRSG